MNITYEIVKSWKTVEGCENSMDEINQWIEERNKNLKVNIEKVDFSYDGFWYYDERKGYIRNLNDSFFQLAGYQEIEEDRIVGEQPIILQNEIGYLGIICKMIHGTLHFLMQTKIEPGNVNVIQLSPTIQATKSNFTRKHGGKAPAYLEYFENSQNHRVIVDQLQSEQSSRFYKKRNRNIIIMVDEDLYIEESHKWMTLGQIKECLKIDNLVNMDTRTVLSCLPFEKEGLTEQETTEIEKLFSDKALYRSIFGLNDTEQFHRIFNRINDYKMYNLEKSRLLPLKSLKGWKMKKKEISCKTPYDFKVIYCRIEIEGREVRYWEQPLIEALGMAVFGIFTCVDEGVRKFLVKVKPEMGCFDSAELGPIVQLEPSNEKNTLNDIETLFFDKLEKEEGVLKKIILSEEGGRFYHEQNQNVIIEINKDEIKELPKDFFWMTYADLNKIIQFNNCVNIQLRNLLTLLDI
jgi:oxidase EvaA